MCKNPNTYSLKGYQKILKTIYYEIERKKFKG